MAKYAIWYFNVQRWRPTRQEWLKLTSSIDRDEVDRINKFVYQEDAKSSLVGCALIREFLAHIAQIPSNEFTLTRTQHGRPAISQECLREPKWPKMMDFNVSHSGDYCVLAGVWSSNEQPNIRLGIDLTKIVHKKTKQELDRFLSLMSRREFTRSEWETVERAQDDRQKCINFTRLWCLKESFIKATGLGLSFKLSRIDFRFDEDNKYNIQLEILRSRLLTTTKVLLDGQPATDWTFLETALDDEHMVAVGYNVQGATEDVPGRVNLPEEISIESVVESLTPMRQTDERNWTIFSSRGTKPMIN